MEEGGWRAERVMPASASSPPLSTFFNTERKLFTSMTSPWMQMSCSGSLNLAEKQVKIHIRFHLRRGVQRG